MGGPSEEKDKEFNTLYCLQQYISRERIALTAGHKDRELEKETERERKSERKGWGCGGGGNHLHER